MVAGETLTFNPVFALPEGKFTNAFFTLDFGTPLVEGATVQYVRSTHASGSLCFHRISESDSESASESELEAHT